ncbi:MAG: aldolase [Verrucomicrobia bacterium]|nr:aldolase [Verrucomicrobiota bacterium]
MNAPASRRLRRSRVLRELRAGRTATCLKSNLADPRVIEIAGLAGVDAVWLCNEHVPSNWNLIEHQVRAAKLHDVDTIVRVEKGSYSDYVKPFEADATGIMVPHVRSAAEAQQIVEWARFQPVGRRPMDGGNADGRFCQAPIRDYLANSLRERFIILQIESPEGLEQLDAILAVPGFDMICFGPGDFAHLIGHPGDTGDPTVVAARARIARRARAAGKFVMAAGSAASRAELAREGHQFFTVGADVIGLANYVRERLAAFAAPRRRKPRRR